MIPYSPAAMWGIFCFHTPILTYFLHPNRSKLWGIQKLINTKKSSKTIQIGARSAYFKEVKTYITILLILPTNLMKSKYFLEILVGILNSAICVPNEI